MPRHRWQSHRSRWSRFQRRHPQPPRFRPAPWPESQPRKCPRRHRPTAGPAWFQRPSRRPGMPPGRAWLRRVQLRHGDARRAGARPRTYPFVSYCLYLERCPEAAPRHRACCARVPPSGSPFPPEPYAHRRHTPQPHARWEAIRLNLNGSGTSSDLRREHPEPRGITVTGTAGDSHPDSPKCAGKPRIRASPHHHLGH